MSEAVTSVTNDTFETVVIQSSNLIMVDFWATWCGPCRVLAPMVEKAAGAYSDKVKFFKVNIEFLECKARIRQASHLTHLISPMDHSNADSITSPALSVKRSLRPLWEYVNRRWLMPSKCRIVA